MLYNTKYKTITIKLQRKRQKNYKIRQNKTEFGTSESTLAKRRNEIELNLSSVPQNLTIKFLTSYAITTEFSAHL